jgi:acetoin utilization deacetylase AcuC-like enzyme
MTDSRCVGFVFDDRYLQHNPGVDHLWTHEGPRSIPFTEPLIHPSNYRLVMRTKHLIDLAGLGKQLDRIEAYEATHDDLAVYHTREYIERVQAICAAGGGETGPGAPAGADSYEIALLSAGGVMAAVDAVIAGRVRTAFANVRPPGHHAMSDRGMGYCIFNNVVVAARHAQRKHGLQRVMILDWDVHDGNGTQDAFYADPSVLFVSLHQDRLYPPSFGWLEQNGSGDGVGTTINVPLPAGSGDEVYLAAFERVILPIAREFGPELIIVSAGQDASLQDPDGRMCLSTEAYRRMTAAMMQFADETCGGRLVIAQEGGYSELYAPYCTLAIVETLLGTRSNLPEPQALDMVLARPETLSIGPTAAAALDEIQRFHAQHWEIRN